MDHNILIYIPVGGAVGSLDTDLIDDISVGEDLLGHGRPVGVDGAVAGVGVVVQGALGVLEDDHLLGNLVLGGVPLEKLGGLLQAVSAVPGVLK